MVLRPVSWWPTSRTHQHVLPAWGRLIDALQRCGRRRATLQDRAREEAALAAEGQIGELNRARRLAERSDAVRIAAEALDVLLDPPDRSAGAPRRDCAQEHRHDVAQAVIPDRASVSEVGMRGEAERIQAARFSGATLLPRRADGCR